MRLLLNIHQRCLIIYSIFLTFVVEFTNESLIPYEIQQMFDMFYHISMIDLENLDKFKTVYEVKSLLTINSVWSSGQNQLLEIFFSETKVSTPKSSKKTAEKTIYDIKKIEEKPFYATINNGKLHQVIAHSSRDQSFLNMKRGIVSLLQFQFESGFVKETDVSGKCNTHYKDKSTTKFEKIKRDCSGWDLRVAYRSEIPLDTWQQSKQQIFYDLTAEGSLLNVKSYESHKIGLNSKPDFGSHLESEFTLKHIAVVGGKVLQIPHETIDEAVSSLLDNYRIFPIEADVDGSISEIHGHTLKKQISIHKDELTDEQIGTEQLAVRMAELLPLARITRTREFIEILKSKTGKKIQNQLIDLLASVQTIDAHLAILAVYPFDVNDSHEYLEKYLQSLAVATHPDRAIIEDLYAQLKDNENSIQNEKLFDTLVQTIASLARQSTLNSDDKLFIEIRNYINEEVIEKCTNIKCKTLFIRALQNLQDIQTIPLLMTLAKSKETKISISALQALKTFPINLFNEAQREEFENIFFQINGKYDSSARTIALDILLDMKPDRKQLDDLLNFLASNDRNYEIKTYLLQKLRMMTDKCPRFADLYSQTLHANANINNYNILAQKGLTTAFHRLLSQAPSFNESIISVQEIQKGVLKRGSVEINLAAGRDEINAFKLGIYASGLSSFVSDTENSILDSEDETSNDEETTAGMEISVQNVHFRPLVFFEGQSELMGHIWSGTASESTPAYQATILAEDSEKYILLQSGATVHIRFIGTKSIDLSGRVTMSIWNRNAHTEINHSTGTAVVGLMSVGTSFAKLEHKMVLSSNPKINLVADSDFYTDTKLCVQLSRPEMKLILQSTKSVKLHTEKKI